MAILADQIADQEIVRPSSTTSPTGGASLWRVVAGDLLALVFLAIGVAAAFGKTVFSGAAISRFYQLGQRDSLFAKYFSSVREAYDASVYQYFVPNHVFTTRSLSEGNLPLWNPLTGCGAPHLADVETAVFWPLRLALLMVEPVRAWNLLLVLNIVIYATGTYALSRVVGLKRLPAIFAAAVLAFCPYLIFQSELIGGCASITPLVIAGFVMTARSPRFVWRALTALACAVMVLSGHPEPVFFGISVACIVRFSLAVFEGADSRKQSENMVRSTASRLLAAGADIAVVGMLSLGMSAFMLLPFVELLANSECYKLGLQGSNFGVSLSSVLVNLLHPAYGNSSPYLGIVVPTMISLALLSSFKNKTFAAVACATVVSVLLMCRVGPLEGLLTWKALSWFVPKYSWPAVLILFSVLSGFGLQAFLQSDEHSTSAAKVSANDGSESGDQRKKIALSVLFATASVALAMLALKFVPSLLASRPIDEAFQQLTLQSKSWVKDLILLGVIALGAATPWLPRQLRNGVAVLIVAICAAVSVGPLVKTAAAPKPAIKYDAMEPLPFLQESGARVVSMGRHVFCPDSNLAYGIQNLVPVNVYHPVRFQTFMKTAGVTHEGVNQFFDGRLNRVVDLASIKYAVSPLPVLGTDETYENLQPLVLVPHWSLAAETVDLQSADLTLFKENAEIIGAMNFRAPANRATDIAWQPVILDDKNQVVWFGDLERLQYMFATKGTAGQATYIKDVAVAVPSKLQSNAELTLAVQVFDWTSSSYLKCDRAPNSAPDKHSLMPVAKFRLDGKPCSQPLPLTVKIGDLNDRRFRLVRENDARIRVYENKNALPPAYWIPNAIPAIGAEDALEKIQNASFDPRTSAVLEMSSATSGAGMEYFANAAPDPESFVSRNLIPCELRRPDTNTVRVICRNNSPGYLVLTDTFYPGWSARVIQRGVSVDAPLLRANYLFKAVAVPGGQCVVEFKYVPLSFIIGAALSAVSLLAVALIVCAAILDSQKRR